MSDRKVLVIGLDGVPLHLIKTWSEEGYLPNLTKILERGNIGNLNSTIPHTSAPAWTAFMTGKNPGKSGVYDFLYRKTGTYTFFPTNAEGRAGRAVWRYLSDAGKKVVVMNVPMTYPIEKVNGAMLGGWMTPYSATDFYHPETLLEEIEKVVGKYVIYPTETFSEEHPQKFLDASHELLKMRTATALTLMRRDAWDFFMLVYFDTDRVLHQMWHHIDPDHFLREGSRDVDKATPVKEYFRAVDDAIGQLVAEAGEDANIILMSDHGMGPTRKMIVLNTWLLREGYIKLRRNPYSQLKYLMFRLGFTLRNVHLIVDKLGLAKHAEYKVLYSADRIFKKIFLSFDDVDWSRTKAYSFGRSNGPVFLNLKGREPHGCVEPGEEYERLREELIAACREMKDPQTGEKLAGQILKREEVYSGPYFEQAPDFMLDPYDERDKFYGLADFGANRTTAPMYRYSGMHRDHGLILFTGPIFNTHTPPENAQIMDLAPTILHILGQPIPNDMDGRPLLEVLRKDHAGEPQYYDAEGDEGRNEPEMDAEAQAQIEERMRKLGYLG